MQTITANEKKILNTDFVDLKKAFEQIKTAYTETKQVSDEQFFNYNRNINVFRESISFLRPKIDAKKWIQIFYTERDLSEKRSDFKFTLKGFEAFETHHEKYVHLLNEIINENNNQNERSI